MSFSRRSFALSATFPFVVTGVLWCAASWSAGYWILQSPASSSEVAVPMNDAADVATAPLAPRLSRALGATAAASPDAPETGRLQLVGVIAGTSGQGSALIALDGQAPKAYRVGQAVGNGLVLQRLSPKRAQLGATVDGPRLQDLQLPADKTP
jgi:general secretion pathway protein C